MSVNVLYDDYLRFGWNASSLRYAQGFAYP